MAEATKAYLWPQTAAPTFAQALAANTVVATLQPADTADTGQITHAFNLSSADMAAGWPTITVEPLLSSAALSNWSIASLDPNYVGFLKNNSTAGTASSAQIRVKISRPNTLVR
jgi:hypothetical protein